MNKGCEVVVKGTCAFDTTNFLKMLFEGAQTVKCKPWTERVAEKGLSRGVSRAAWKRRINRELEAKKGAQTVNYGGAKPWSANHELGTFSLEIPVFQFTVCTSWLNRKHARLSDVMQQYLRSLHHSEISMFPSFSKGFPCAHFAFYLIGCAESKVQHWSEIPGYQCLRDECLMGVQN